MVVLHLRIVARKLVIPSTWHRGATINKRSSSSNAAHEAICINIAEVALDRSLHDIGQLRIHIWHLLLLVDHVQMCEGVLLSWIEFLNNVVHTSLKFKWSPIVLPASIGIWCASYVILKAASRIEFIVGPLVLLAEVLVGH